MRLTVPQAALLGAIHGPAELLPVSSSAHVELLPVLLGWDRSGMTAAERKAFEVALHAGSLAGLLRVATPPRPGSALLTTIPAVVAGLAFERPIEERLGGVRATAAGLIAGSAILVAADRRRVSRPGRAPTAPAELLAIGAAQAVALVPGLSRLGMAASAARLLGYERSQAFATARSAGLPVLAGATALKASRVARAGLAPDLRRPFVAGALAAAGASLAAAPLARRTPVRRAAAWRVGLAVAALRQNGRR